MQMNSSDKQFANVPRSSRRSFEPGISLEAVISDDPLDGVNGKQVDQQTDNSDLNAQPNAASFSRVRGAECRFIALVQAGTKPHREEFLVICCYVLS
jgi:hypothetical protein